MARFSPTISLYAHIPFCAGKCLYCDFYSVVFHPDGQAAGIIKETVEQTRAFLDVLQKDAAETIYVGGGTPSVVPMEDLEPLLEFLGLLRTEEWTVEANPESLDEGFMSTCARHGVTRLSVGMQSGDEANLKTLGRPGNVEANARAYELLGAWKGDSSVDYICGIPGQSFSDLEREISLLRRRSIGHASLYSLTVEEDTLLSRLIESGVVAPNTPEADEEMWLQGKRLLEENGFSNYEISNFALPGEECRHNLRYWRLEPYLGVGPGAVSTLPTRAVSPLLMEKGQGIDTEVVRLSNPRSLEAFLSGRRNLWGIEMEPIGGRDFLFETLIMGLRTARGIDHESFQRRFGRDFKELFPGLRERWIDEGVGAHDSESIALTETGRLFLNTHLREISAEIYRDDFPSLKLTWP